jgi:hypothetical protein
MKWRHPFRRPERGDADTARASTFALEEHLREKKERDAERDRQIASLREMVDQLSNSQKEMAEQIAARVAAGRIKSIDPQTQPELFAELEQRMLEIARKSDKRLRDFHEAFAGAERQKREHERRLRVRLAEIRAANGSAA